MTPPEDGRRDNTLLENDPDPGPYSAHSHRRGAVEVLTVFGELDLVTVPKLRDEVLRCLDSTPPVLVLDLLGLTFIASTGLSLLVEAHGIAGPATALRIVANQREILRPIQTTGLDHVLPMFSTVDDALA